MKTIQKQKRYIVRCVAAAALGMLFFTASAFPQCNMNDNGYVFLHPAFANKNWGKAWYDSISIVLPDTLCAAKPVRYDICGPAASAVAVYSNSANELFLMKTQYWCPQPKPLCTSCILEYLDPSQIALSGVALAQNTPLYLVKSPVYGGDSVKVLVKNTQKKVVALALSTTSLAVLHMDTLATSALLPQQDIIRIQGVAPWFGRPHPIFPHSKRQVGRRNKVRYNWDVRYGLLRLQRVRRHLHGFHLQEIGKRIRTR